MQNLISASAIACLAIVGGATAVLAGTEHNPANTIQLVESHPDSFRHFATELPSMSERAAQINTEFGLHVSEIGSGLYFVTDMIYQSAFLVTDEAVVVFDAPPSFGEGLRSAIDMAAPGVPITHLIMSHAHRDHNGGGYTFADIDDLNVVAAADNAASLARNPLEGFLAPTQIFEDALELAVGGVPIELRTAHFHAEDTDVIIYLPEHKFLMAIDTITPGEAPFMNFGATSNVNAYLESFENFLSYDFEHFLSGHVSVLGNREDVVKARDYAWDVRDTVHGLMPHFTDRVMKGMQAVSFQNGNLAYRYAMETIRDECAEDIIGRWQTELSVVDLWADSHCETTLLYAIMH